MKNLTILLAEDEEFLRELYIEEFEEAGFDTFQASNGSEALEIATKQAIDIIILDINMPIMNGTEALAMIKKDQERYGNPVTIMLTSLSSDSTISDSYEKKADGYLIKQELLPDEIVNEIKGIYSELRGEIVDEATA